MRDDSEFILTRETILSGHVADMVRSVDPSVHVLTEAELRRSRDALLDGHSGDLWVFAYGSLIWNPAFHHVERRQARLHGYHRKFCLRTHIGRGTPELPGLMLGLESGGSCTGFAYRIAADAIEQETHVLWKREMVVGSYEPRWVVVDGAGPDRRAITFVINKRHSMYASGLPRAEIVHTLANARGILGRGCDYIFELVESLDDSGIHDHALASIAEEVRELQRGSG